MCCMESIENNETDVLVTEDTIDPAAASKAYALALPRAEAVPASDRSALTVDVQDATLLAEAVARFLAEPEVRARFGMLPRELFDPGHLDDLLTLSLATHHAHVLLQTIRAGGSTAKLSANLVLEASEVRTRMLELCEYVFRRDPVLSAEVASIRLGTGYKDHAMDLVRLANLYEQYAAIVARDTFNYRATDAADARRLAQAIRNELGQSQGADERHQLAIVTALWTLLVRCYNEIQAAGQFLYRNEDADRKFPSLFTRKSRRSRPAPETPETLPESPEA
jgi:hypothetical protein